MSKVTVVCNKAETINTDIWLSNENGITEMLTKKKSEPTIIINHQTVYSFRGTGRTKDVSLVITLDRDKIYKIGQIYEFDLLF